VDNIPALHHRASHEAITICVVLYDVVVSVFAIESKVIAYIPGQGRWVLKDNQNPQHAFLRRGSRTVVRFYGILKICSEYEEIIRKAKFAISSCFATR
jgi:hypothetical protein